MKRTNEHKTISPWIAPPSLDIIPPEYNDQLRHALDAAIADEAKAGKEYREIAELARKAGREEFALRIENIASQEDSHYQILLSMMLSINPGYKGMIKLSW